MSGARRVAKQTRGMRSQLRRFAAVGVLVTVVDFAVLFVLRLGFGLPVLIADTIAIATSALVSFGANRLLTFTRDPHLRWVEQPLSYALVTGLAGVIDVLVLRSGYAVFNYFWIRQTVRVYGEVSFDFFGIHSHFRDYEVRWLLVSKAVALAVAGAVRVIGYRGLLFRQVRAAIAQPAADRAPAPGSVRFSVVIPAYKAAGEIGHTVQRLADEVGGVIGRKQLEIVVVDDGSDDGTADAAEAAGADLVVRQLVNRGKGASVRAGMLDAHGRTIAFTDADLAYEPALLLDVLTKVEEGWDVVVGSRGHIETVTLVRTGRLRALGSRVINLMSLAVVLGAYRDTQCGLKAFRSDAARQIFSVARIDRFAFDIEVFHLVERFRLTLLEVPVTLTNSGFSTVKVGLDSLRVLVDMLRIRRFAGKGAYDPSN
jgi:putative flippase GtrA